MKYKFKEYAHLKYSKYWKIKNYIKEYQNMLNEYFYTKSMIQIQKLAMYLFKLID